MKSEENAQDSESVELQRLREENARLKSLLDAHGIVWADSHVSHSGVEVIHSAPLSPAEKVALFRRLFRGRTDAYPLRWESAKGKAGYSPACGNEWRPGICGKPKLKCGSCSQRKLLPLTDQVIYDHLSGKHTIGCYPLLNNDTCCFLAIDFDDADWRGDVCAVMQSCRDLAIPALVEVSRSGNGAHIWIFFANPLPAHEARQLGAALLSHACSQTRQLSFASYDRFFPNQDTLPKGGFGNLIALPLQKRPREQGRSVFVDENFEPYPDQWDFLSSIHALSSGELESAMIRACGGRHPLDVAFTSEEDGTKPWQRTEPETDKIPGSLPASLTLVLANQIFIAKSGLPQPLLNRIVRLGAFQNPEFYKAQAMRLPVWDKSRIIGCAENFQQYVGLPRGCLPNLLSLLENNEIGVILQDERGSGNKITAKFTGVLRKDQKEAVKAMLAHDTGVLHAPTAFGKTVVAAAIIAKRKMSTLVLTHRAELLRQWQERLTEFLDMGKGEIGLIGGGKKKPSGKIDIALLQTISRQNDAAGLLEAYGQVIVDECHHISAFSFESVHKLVKARCVLGLTATPIRRDGHHPIIFMQCGPIRHSAAHPQTAPTQLEVWPQCMPTPSIPPDSGIQEVFRILAQSEKRNRKIVEDARAGYSEGRKILILTERTEHLELLREGLGTDLEHCHTLHGRLSKKQRLETLNALAALDGSTPRILLATGRLIGEGFDHSALDTLLLAMPISWKGTLQQYAGRLHREHAGKSDVRIYDYIEQDNPALCRMWEKRRRGYAAMGYTVMQANIANL